MDDEIESFTIAWCVGGPYDGRAFTDMPVFANGPAARADMPYGDEGELAAYLRREAPDADGRWYYDHVEQPPAPVTELPIGTTVRGAVDRQTAEAQQRAMDEDALLREFERQALALTRGFATHETDLDELRVDDVEDIDTTCGGMFPIHVQWGEERVQRQCDLARRIAAEAHAGQVDKLGDDYLGHPARVASRFDPRSEPVAHCAAWLHDVVEDTGVEVAELRDLGVAEEILDVVVLLTRRPGQRADRYYAAIRSDLSALRVKAADIDDNLDPSRTVRLDAATRERLAAKYARARRALGISVDA